MGLAQLVSKDSGDPYQLMMTGLVMLGAIETNGSDVPLSRTTPIATMITESEAIVVPAKSKYQSFKDLAAAFKRDPGSIRWAGGSAGSTDQLLVGELARVLGADPKKAKYVAHSGGGEANAAILSGSVDAGVSGLSEFTDQVEAGKMRLLAVSSPVDTKVDGSKPPTIKDEGIDLELTNWRMMVAPPGLSDGERSRITGYIQKVLKSPQWADAVKRNDWTPFVKTGDELDSFVASRAEAGAAGRGRSGDRQVIGARAFGGVLLAVGVVCLVSSLGVGDGWAASGPRLAPVVASLLLIGLSVAFLVRPGDELAAYVREATAGTDWRTPVLLVALLIGYAESLSALGYALATTIFFWLAAWLLGSDRPGRDVLVGVVLGVVTSFAFTQWLNVQLPTGPWGV